MKTINSLKISETQIIAIAATGAASENTPIQLPTFDSNMISYAEGMGIGMVFFCFLYLLKKMFGDWSSDQKMIRDFMRSELMRREHREHIEYGKTETETEKEKSGLDKINPE